MSDGLTDLAIKFLQDHGLGPVAGAIAVGVLVLMFLSAVVTWALVQATVIRKWVIQGIEARLKDGQILKEIEIARTQVSSVGETQGLHLRAFLEALRAGDAKRIHTEREELCRFLSKEHHDAFITLLDRCVVYVKKGDFLEHAQVSFIPALQSKLKVLDVINLSEALQRCENAAPYKINRTSTKVQLRKIRRRLPKHALWTRFDLFMIGWNLRKHYRPKT